MNMESMSSLLAYIIGSHSQFPPEDPPPDESTASRYVKVHDS